MRILTLVLLAAACYGGFQWWQERRADDALATASPNGFVPVEMPSGVPGDVVLVLAPPNCPSDQAQRAETLIAELGRAGIPVRRGSGFSFSVDDPSAEQRAGIDRAVAVFQRGAPAVFVNGMAMSDPSPLQTIAEYRRTRQ
ncbi:MULTISPECIES: hypothetical protein [Luteimonas]|uniref:hypothetical protein n=1 Tax=Luteimonas TaxID=83614 RepID=UPI000C7DB376|nr:MULTISPECIES: hypothetical protein [Luteimonas]